MSCITQLVRMFRLIYNEKQVTPTHSAGEKQIFFKGKAVAYHAATFGQFCCALRNAMSHLYNPGKKNSICTVYGFRYPSNLNLVCDFKELSKEIERRIDAGNMCFDVFVGSIISSIERHLFNRGTFALVYRDILMYSRLVLSRYSTLGEDLQPSPSHGL